MGRQSSNWGRWVEFFSARADRALPELTAESLTEVMPASVARSLAIFQLGESGGGTIIKQARSSQIEEINDAYADAMALFVREENRHADILAICVRRLGGELIRENWTAKLFVWSRRLIGLRLKVIVLLAAEVVGICYYRLLASRMPPCDIKSWLAQLVDDEKSHLQFHCQFLRSQASTPIRRWLFIITWRLTMLAAAIVVILDHRAAIRDIDLDYATIWDRWWHYANCAERLVCHSTVTELKFGQAPVK